jgi:DNA polymerase-3 subunit delta
MLYLLSGENVYESNKRLEELIAEFRDRYDGQVQAYNADEVESYNDILKDADSLSLFSKEKLIIIKRFFQSNSQSIDAIEKYINSTKHLNLIFWEDRPADKRKRAYKTIKKKGVVEEFKELKYAGLRRWLNSYMKERIDFEPECTEELIYKLGSDQMQLASSVDNLATLLNSKKQKTLKASDIDSLIDKTAEEDIWEFIDAISENKKDKALEITERLLAERSDFVMIIGMIAREFRILSLVRALLDQGKNHSEVSRTLKLHPFVLRKAVAHSKNFTLDSLKKLFRKLVKTDLVVKTGRFDEKLALDLLIAAI